MQGHYWQHMQCLVPQIQGSVKDSGSGNACFGADQKKGELGSSPLWSD